MRDIWIARALTYLQLLFLVYLVWTFTLNDEPLNLWSVIAIGVLFLSGVSAGKNLGSAKAHHTMRKAMDGMIADYKSLTDRANKSGLVSYEEMIANEAIAAYEAELKEWED